MIFLEKINLQCVFCFSGYIPKKKKNGTQNFRGLCYASCEQNVGEVNVRQMVANSTNFANLANTPAAFIYAAPLATNSVALNCHSLQPCTCRLHLR